MLLLQMYSELLESCPEVGILQHSMGESCCGKSCLFAERKGTLVFCIFFESSVYMVFYESLNLTGRALIMTAVSFSFRDIHDVHGATSVHPRRSDKLLRGITIFQMRGTTAAGAASLAFEHISVSSFLPLAGPSLPRGVIVPFRTKSSGSFGRKPKFGRMTVAPQTPGSFCEMLEACCFVPMRQSYPDSSQPIIILMDTGGGSLLHLSIPTVLLHRYGAFPFIFPSFTTKAICPRVFLGEQQILSFECLFFLFEVNRLPPSTGTLGIYWETEKLTAQPARLGGEFRWAVCILPSSTFMWRSLV